MFTNIKFSVNIKIGDNMICNRCGAPLPNDGVVCKQCGAMMSKEQIEEQKKWKEINKQSSQTVNLMSSRYGVNKDNFDYSNEPKKENKLLGLLILVGILLIVIIFAIIKFFS